MSHSQQMVEALDRQELEEAEVQFQQALLEDSEAQLLDLGQYLESIGFYPQAKEIYEQIAETYPEVYLSLATILAEEGQMEEAFAYLEEIGPESNWYVASLLVKADLYQMEGLADVAREKLVEAVAETDEALMERYLEGYQEAIQEYAQLDNREILEATGISTYQRIGFAYANLGKFEAAVPFLEKALEIEFDDQIAYELATLLSDQEEFQKALIYYKQIDTLSPDFEGYEYGYALALQAENDREKALEIAKQGIQKNPFDAQLKLLASRLSYELHQPEQAEAYLLEAKEVADDLEEIALRLTTLYLEQERFDQVLAWQNEEVETVVTRWNIARALSALEKTEEAVSAYQELYEDLKDNPEFLEAYVYLLREAGDVTKAREVANQYLAIVPDDVQMQTLYDSL